MCQPLRFQVASFLLKAAYSILGECSAAPHNGLRSCTILLQSRSSHERRRDDATTKTHQMDPLSALAVATAATQFLEFGVKVVSGTWERYQAVAGAAENHIEIGSVASRLRQLASDIRRPFQDEAPQSGPRINPQHGKQLERITKNCQDAANELLALLAELKASGRYKLAESLIITVKAIRKEKKVQQLNRKLLSTQSELSLCLVALV